MLVKGTCFDTVLIEISQYRNHKDITLIVSDRRRRITIKKDVLQATNVLYKMFVRAPSGFSCVLGETHQPAQPVILERYCFLEVMHFHRSRIIILNISSTGPGNHSVITRLAWITAGSGLFISSLSLCWQIIHGRRWRQKGTISDRKNAHRYIGIWCECFGEIPWSLGCHCISSSPT